MAPLASSILKVYGIPGIVGQTFDIGIVSEIRLERIVLASKLKVIPSF
jgi:hypothetical protein